MKEYKMKESNNKKQTEFHKILEAFLEKTGN